MYYSVLCMYVLRILYSHTYRQARKYLCLDTVIYRFVVTCKRLHAQQWLTNLSTAITFFPNRPKVLSCVLTRNEMNYCLKKCNDTLWCGVPLLAQLAKNAQGHGRRYWTTITRNKLMKSNVSIMKRIRIHKLHSLESIQGTYFVLAMKIVFITIQVGIWKWNSWHQISVERIENYLGS